MVCPAIFGHLMSFVPCWCTSLVFLFGFTFLNRQLFFALFLVDVIAFLLADVVAIVLYGRCYNHQADVMPIFIGRCFANFVYACGRCCCHIFMWQMFIAI